MAKKEKSSLLIQLLSLFLFALGCQQKVQFGIKWELNSIGNEYFVHVHSTKKLEINGGMPPFTFSVYDDVNKVYTNKNSIGEIDNNGVFTAYAKAGVTQVQILDIKNNRHEVTINVAEPIQLTVDRNMIYSAESLQLNVRGGFGKIRYQIIGFGQIDASNIYSANSGEFGQVIIQAQDSMGFKDQKTINVVRPLQVFPIIGQVIKGSKKKYTIEGGTPPFQIKIQPTNSAISSIISQVGSVHEFELSTQQITGQLNIEIIDSSSIPQKTTAQLELLNPLSVNVSSIYLAKGQTYSELKVTGGIVGLGGYTITGCEGNIQLSGQYTIKAGNQITQCQMVVTDQQKNSVAVSVSITENLSLSATHVTMVKNEVFDLVNAVKGGVPPFYLVTSLANSSTLQLLSGTQTQIKAINVSQGIDLKLRDSQTGTPNEVTVKVSVTDGLSISPSQVTIAVGNSQDFSVVGGIGPYTYKVKSGSGSFDLALPNRYLGPNTQGSATVEVTDSQGRTANANVLINQALTSSNIPSVNGNPLIELVNQSQHQKFSFQILTTGGAGGNSYTSSATGVVSVTNSGLIQAVGSGNAKVTVTDAKNNKLEIPVIVYAPLVISPTNLFIARTTENSNTSIIGGKSSNYQVNVNNSFVSSVIINTNKIKVTASINTGSSVITVSDGLQQGTLNVTNYGPINLSPLNLSLKVGTTAQFQISGGVPNYKVSVLNDLANNQVATVNKSVDVTPSDQLNLTAKNKAGTYQLSIQDQVMSQNFNYQVTADQPAQLKLSIAQTTVNSGTCVQLTAGLVDQYQNNTAKVGDTNLSLGQSQISVAANSQAIPGDFYSDSSCQNKITSTFIPSNQQSTQFFYHAKLAGQFGLSIQSQGFITQSVNLTVQVALANKLAFLQLPLANSKETLATTVKVAIVDNAGNVITNGSGNLSLTKASGPANGTLSNTAATFVNGIAEISNLSFSVAGQYTLTASISGGVSLNSVTSNNFVINENLYDITLTPGQTEEPLKIIFIVDNSNTMSQNQQNLVNGIDNFLGNLLDLNLEFYILTTDNSGAGARYNDTKILVNNIQYQSYQEIYNQYPVGTEIVQTNLNDYYYLSPTTYKIFKNDSNTQRTTMLNNIKNKILSLGTNGNDNEYGVFNFSRIIAGLNNISILQEKSAIKKYDKILVLFISDEDENLATHTQGNLNNYLPSQRTMISKMKLGADTLYYTYNYSGAYVQVNIDSYTQKDGVLTTVNRNLYYRTPDAYKNSAENSNCTSALLLDIQDYINARRVGYPIYSDMQSPLIKSCVFKKYTETFKTTDQNLCSNLSNQMASHNNSLNLFYCNLTSTETVPGSITSTSVSDAYDYSFTNQLATLYGTLWQDSQTTMLQAQNNWRSLVKAQLDSLFTPKGYYFSFIINPANSSCNLSNGQSIGAQHTLLSQELGTQSSIIPICQPNQYSSALTDAGLVMKTYMNGSFTIQADVVNEVKYVDRIRGSIMTRLTKDVHYTVNGKNIQVNIEQLTENDQIKIYWK